MIGVVLARRGENPELRYAMRSWEKNVGQVTDLIAVGLPPDWVGCRTVHTPQSLTKYANTTNGLLYACRNKLLPEKFVLLNDDFFAMRETYVPNWHRGPMFGVVAEYRARGINSSYVRGMEATARALVRDGIEDPLCYEVHAPMIIERDRLAEVLAIYSNDPSINVLHKRSAYGNLAGVGGIQVEDVKLRTETEASSATSPHPVWNGTLPHLDWLSTSDAVWGAGAGSLIMAKFPVPSRWERNPNVRRNRTSPGRIRHVV